MVDWEALIPTVYYQAETPTTTTIYNLAVAYTAGSAISGTIDIDTELIVNDSPTTITDNIVIEVEANDLNSTLKDIDVDTTVQTAIDRINNIPVSMIHIEQITGSRNLEHEYIISTTLNKETNVDIELKFYIAPADVESDTLVDVTISDDMRFTFDADIFSTRLATLSGIEADIEVTTGIVHSIVTDLFNSEIEITAITADTFSSDVNQESFGLEATLISGTINSINTDSFATVSGVEGIGLDVRTWSMFVTDFFLSPDEHQVASGQAWIDIVDFLWSIDTANTYFMVDGVAVSGTTFSGINNGYRVSYDPPSDFDHEGPFTYTIHAQNIQGDILEQDYSLLYGYDVAFNKVIEWGPHRQIDILTKATNNAYCSNTAAESFYFVTKDYEAHNLGSTILPTRPVDISSSIGTIAKVFYYGGAYTVTVSGIRDYAGNELDPIQYSFTIENPIG